MDHDTLTNFVADEHVAHTGVTLTAGAGLSGGGDISANRSFATASGEANFLADGGVTSLTCGVSNQGKAQVMDDGSIEYCDGAATSVLRQGFLDADGVDADTIFSPNADPGVDHSGYVAGGPGTDNTAIHDDTASEISTITLKATPVSADMLLIEDSAATNAKKRITIGSLPASAEVNDLTAAVTWANVPDANVSGINERDEVCGTTDLDATCNINTAVIGRTQIDETLLSIQTHATDCTLLTCDASSDGEQCFQQSTNAVYTCDGSGTPAWTTPAVGGSQNLFETINASSGTDPVADSATDTLALTGTAPIVATGASATDTVTFSLTQNAGTDVTADLEEETHASEHSLGGTDAITATNLASACTDAQVLGGTSAGTGVECQTGNDDDVYNIVTDYSAACDGAMDDTTEIQAAIDAANTAGGGIVYVPEGTCVLLTVVNLKSNVVLRGEGPSSILKLSSSAAVNTNMLAMTTGITNVVIEDLSLDGNAANQLNTDGAAIKLDHTTTALDNIVIRRVNFHDHDQYGIRTVGNTSVTRLKIINNVFKDMGSGAGSGAHTIHMNQAAPGVIISRNHIDTVGATGNCIWVGNQSDNALIADNYCKSPAAMGIEFWTNTIGQAAIRGNVIDSPGTFGISLALSPNSSVAGNVVNSPTSLGIEVARSDHSTVSANIVKNSGTSGITVDQSSYVTVSNNTVESGGDANPESGIDLVNGANAALSYNNVVGNTIKMKALSAVRGVNLRCDNTTKVCKGNLIANNIITGDATTSQRAINTERDGAAAATCSDTMIVDNHLENVDVGVRNGCTNSIIANNDFVTVTTKRQTITSGTQKILELACDGTKCDLDIDDDGVAEYSFDAGGLSASEAPGTVVTAGDALTLTGSDIDFDGGAAPAGELGGTWASPTVDAIHSGSAHHSAVTVSGTPDYITLSGQDIVRGTVDISDDTNLTAGDGITLTLDDLDWDGVEVDSNGTPQGNLLGIDFGNLFSLTKENGCVGGTEPGSSCTTNTDCAGSGTCTASSQHAVGLSAQVYVQGDTIQTADLPAVVKNRFV
ncbi:MAG: glycosyl hydrolase family 28-related protein, partial [Phycisphaerae bacterium]